MRKAVILIVDDEEEILTMLTRFLTRRGYEVVTAGNLEDGKERLKNVEPNFLFLDVNLPDGNGLRSIPEFKAISPGVDIILMSAFNDTGMQTTAKEKGAIAFLNKPFSLDAINKLIE